MKNLVELKGTEKQVAWAEDIRATYLRKLETYRELINKENLDQKEKSTLAGAMFYISGFSNLSDYFKTYLANKGLTMKETRNYPREERRMLSRQSKEEAKKVIDEIIEERLNRELASDWIDEEIESSL